MKKHVVNITTGITKDVDLTPDETAQIKKDRDIVPRPPENTSLRTDDIERILTAHLGITPQQIADAKRNRQ